MGIVKARRIGAEKRPDQDHGRTGGADDAGNRGAEHENRAVDEGCSAQVAGHQDAAGNHVERKQQHDEAQILGQHGVHEGCDGGRRTVQRRERRDRERRPCEGELAVVAMPDSWKQQRTGGNSEQNADERQRPWPAQQRAVERCCGMRCVGSGGNNGSEQAASQAPGRHIYASRCALVAQVLLSLTGSRPVGTSLDYLIGTSEQGRRHFDAERLGGRQVDDEIELDRLLDRQVGRLCPAQDLIDIVAGAPVKIQEVRSIGHQTAGFGELPKTVHRRQSCAQRQGVDAGLVSGDERIGSDIKRLRAARECLEGGRNIRGSTDLHCRNVEATPAGRCLNLSHLQHGRWIGNSCP